MSSDNPPLLNKRELAKVLAVSVVTVNAYLDRFENFPVVQAGTNGKEWQFDAVAVKQFLAAREAEEDQAERIREEHMAQLGLGLDESDKKIDANLKPAERLNYVRALKAEDEIAVSRGYLVQTARVRSELSNTITRWNKALHASLRQAGRDLNLPDAVTRALEDRLANAQRRFVDELSSESAMGQDEHRRLA